MTRGFTIMELTVVLSIFGILSAIVLARFSTFNEGIAVQNLAQDIALRIRQAQNAAVGGQYPKLTLQQAVPPANWKASYGVYFDTANPKSFVYFFDSELPGDLFKGVYNDIPGAIVYCGSGGSECLDVISIAGGEEILNITDAMKLPFSKVALTFTRPFPNVVATNNVPGTTQPILPITITIGKPGSTMTKTITVTSLGQISVQ